MGRKPKFIEWRKGGEFALFELDGEKIQVRKQEFNPKTGQISRYKMKILIERIARTKMRNLRKSERIAAFKAAVIFEDEKEYLLRFSLISERNGGVEKEKNLNAFFPKSAIVNYRISRDYIAENFGENAKIII